MALPHFHHTVTKHETKIAHWKWREKGWKGKWKMNMTDSKMNFGETAPEPTPELKWNWNHRKLKRSATQIVVIHSTRNGYCSHTCFSFCLYNNRITFVIRIALSHYFFIYLDILSQIYRQFFSSCHSRDDSNLRIQRWFSIIAFISCIETDLKPIALKMHIIWHCAIWKMLKLLKE